MQHDDHYDSDLTDDQFAAIGDLLPPPAANGRPRKHSLHAIVNATMYVARTGCQWRQMPKGFPPWQTVYHYFSDWCHDGTWESIHDRLRRAYRAAHGKEESATAGIIDAQSVHAAEYAEQRGYDAGKKKKGHKRHLVVDTLGLIMAVIITTGNVQDRDAAVDAIRLAQKRNALEVVFADQGYAGKCESRVLQDTGVRLEIVRRNPEPGFVVLPKRWIVERTNSWLYQERRLTRDYERKYITVRAFTYIALIRKMVRYLY